MFNMYNSSTLAFSNYGNYNDYSFLISLIAVIYKYWLHINMNSIAIH